MSTRFLLVLLVLVPLLSCSQSAGVVANNESIAQAIENFSSDPDLSHASWGFYAQSVQSGRTLASYNADKSLTPASTLKSVTTMAALGMLGAGYTYTTTLEITGTVNAGVLTGDVYIRGGGDPTLATPKNEIASSYNSVIEQWIKAVQQQGITAIEGRVIGDASFFSEEMAGPKWIWEDMGNYYGAGASGLSFHENRYNVVFNSGAKLGDATQLIKVVPEVPNFELVNRVLSGPEGSGDKAYIYSSPYSNIGHIRGTIPPSKSGFTIKGATPDPALYAAHCLTKALEKKGLKVKHKASTVRLLQLAKEKIPTKGKRIHSLQSPALKDIVFWTNKQSVNLFAEHLLRTMGKEQYGRGSIENGLKAVEQFWKERGVSVAGLIMHDGSGLSPLNAVSAKTLTQMQAKFTKDANYTAYYNSLAVAGDSNDKGYLKSFMRGTGAANNMRVKSGYIGGHRAYTGYVYTKEKELLAFTIIVNKYSCSNSKMKKKIERLLASLVNA